MTRKEWLEGHLIRNTDSAAGIPVVFGLLFKKKKLPTMLGGEFGEFRRAMSIVAENDCYRAEFGRDGFIFSPFVVGRVIAVVDE